MSGTDWTPEAEARLRGVLPEMAGHFVAVAVRQDDISAVLRRVEEQDREIGLLKDRVENLLHRATTEEAAERAEQAEARIEELEAEAEGIRRLLSDEKVGVSTNIADWTTYGYGLLDDNGFWQYPVPEALVALKQAEAWLARVEEALREYLDVLDNAPEESSTTDLRVLAAQDTSWFKGKANSELVAKVVAVQDTSPEKPSE